MQNIENNINILLGDNVFSKYNWKQTIYKDDLKNVILNGLLVAILGGILAGLVDYAFQLLNLVISIGLLLLCYLIAFRVKKAYTSYHILYPVLAIVFLIIGLFFKQVSYYFCLMPDVKTFSLLIDGGFYLSFILSPFQYLISAFKSFNIYTLLIGIIDLIIYILAFIYTYRFTKGRNWL